MRARYVDRMRDADVLTVASDLGIETTDGHGTSPGSFPCPACGVETRHGERKRGACGARTDCKGWRCFEVYASADALDLVAWVLKEARFRDLDDEGRKRVREWVDRRDGMSPPERKLHVVQAPAPRPPAALI